MEETAELLFAYLRDILYAPNKAELDLDALPPEFRKLGQGMQFLADCVREEREFALELAHGNLTVTPPGGENMLAAPIKELQNSLRHLTWQTGQVAKGDYSQRVDFMGEFSEAFNSMIAQLKERTESLIAEKKMVESKNRDIERDLELVLALTNYTHNMIFVFSKETGERIFVNQPADWQLRMGSARAERILEQLAAHDAEQTGDSEKWEFGLPEEQDMPAVYYGVESFSIQWKQERASVHIVTDDTARHKRESMVYQLACIDPLTGLNNRRYAIDRMNRWVDESTPFVLSFIDIDYLKYCNDTFGHESGDRYLNEVANALQTLGGELCRVGGDEFFLLQPHSSAQKQDERLSMLRTLLQEQPGAPYPRGFSFGSCAMPSEPDFDLEECIRQADMRMYEYKRRNKRPLAALLYHDERM